MKRALLPLIAAALVLSACGGEDASDTASEATASSSTSATESSASSTADDATTASSQSVNEQVRAACQLELVKQAADATFPTSGSLRAASDAEGKLYTVTGTALAAGAEKPYTCSVLVTADSVEVTEATIG